MILMNLEDSFKLKNINLKKVSKLLSLFTI